MILPIIMLTLTTIGGLSTYFFTQKKEKNKYKEKDNKSVNEFINVKDIKGNHLYTRDGLVLSYLKIEPISIDLYSKTEKDNMIKSLTSELSDIDFPFKFIAVSRPIDISPLLNELNTLLMTSDRIQKELVKAEMIEMGNYALSGDIVERQFYLIMWDKQIEGAEKELLSKGYKLVEKFRDCKVRSSILNQQDIVKLCNLVNNPAYAHFEDDDFESSIPLLSK